jgi:hypothetical protein
MYNIKRRISKYEDRVCNYNVSITKNEAALKTFSFLCLYLKTYA